MIAYPLYTNSLFKTHYRTRQCKWFVVKIKFNKLTSSERGKIIEFNFEIDGKRFSGKKRDKNSELHTVKYYIND